MPRPTELLALPGALPVTDVNADAPARGWRILVLFGNIPMWGQERAVIHAIEVLRDAGAECLFVTHPQWGHEQVQPALEARGLKWTTAPYADRFQKGMGWRQWLRNLVDIARASWRLLGLMREFRPTHLHVANPQMFLNFLPALLLTRTPVIYQLGDAPEQRRLHYRWLWRWGIVRRTARFICVSRYISERLLAAGARSDTLSVVYPPPPPRWTVPNMELPARDPSRTTFVFVGQLAQHKGLHLAVRAALRLLDEGPVLRLLIAGDYSWKGEFALNLRDEAIRRGWGEQVQFLGSVEAIPDLLSRCDVHLCPTLAEEPYGLVVAEAKQAGLPSIVFRRGGLPELVTDGRDGLICASADEDGLYRAMSVYLLNPSLRARHAEAALASSRGSGIEKFRQALVAEYAMAGSA